MPFGAVFAGKALGHYFNNAAHTNVGDAAGLQPAATEGNVYLSLHTAAPVSGLQQASECAYTGYGRQAVPRNASDLVVSGDEVALVNNVSCGECTAGSESATHWALGYDSAANLDIFAWGPLDAPIAIAPGINPTVKAGSTIEFRDNVT